jgi:FkbM family methyltransferase
MLDRFRVLNHWIGGQRNNVSFLELISVLFSSSSTRKAKKLIKKQEKIKDYYVFYFEDFTGITSPLYWPRNANLYNLYVVIRELCYESDWHYYEKYNTDVLASDTVLDCGAAEGLFSLSVANRCKKVYAIEPLNSFIKSLKLSFSNYKNIELLPVGLSDQSGCAYMDDKDTWSRVSEGGEYNIKISTIDDLFYKKGIEVNFIKADVEGFDFKIIKGARATISKNKPKIAITTYHEVDHANLISKYLKDIDSNYKISITGIKPENGAPIMLHAYI